MKEKIYTIPINEAFDEDSECPLCYLRAKLEAEAVDYSLGGAMMEPDYRIVSNEKGYCNRHFSMMLPKKEKLSLALVLETHMKEVREKLEQTVECVKVCDDEKRKFFGAKKLSIGKKLNEEVSKITDGCVICEKLSDTMERFVSVLFYLWNKESEFKEKLAKSKGFCLPHFSELSEAAFKYLDNKKAREFVNIISDIEKTELARLQDEVHKFTLKFDYRNVGEKWGSEIDAPKRCLEKLSGYVNTDV